VPDPLDPQRGAAPARFVAVVFGFIFAGIGVTVLVSLWSRPFGAFGSPPLIFRVLGSFIALGFIAVGGAVGLSTLLAGRAGSSISNASGSAVERQNRGERGASSKPGYACPRCGAPLADEADVSPHGDVKCTYCNAWFNVFTDR
jgi:DNA-directed RNA polymerase subunit RPC12/RpoP